MWVPEWPWVAPWRHSRSTAATTVSPSTNSPDSTLTRCAQSVLAIFWTSVTAAFAVAGGSRSGDGAFVGDLAAGLGVERCAVQDQLDAVRLLLPSWATTGTRLPSTKMPRILASEVNSSKPVNSVGTGVDEFAVSGQVGVRLLAGGGVGLGALPLFGHQAAEALFVDGQAGLGRHFEGQLDREAVGVVQREGVGARQHRRTRLLRRAGGLLEQP